MVKPRYPYLSAHPQGTGVLGSRHHAPQRLRQGELHVQMGEVSQTHTEQHPDSDMHVAVPLVGDGQAMDGRACVSSGQCACDPFSA